MKRILILLVVMSALTGCATLPKGAVSACLVERSQLSFFAQGEKLVAFRMTAITGDYGLDGILQIKKQATDQYEVTVFSNVGAYRLLQATVTREAVQYAYLAPGVNHTAVQIKVERFLNLLLISPQSQGVCRATREGAQVNYKHPIKKYSYVSNNTYPIKLTGPKAFGKVHFLFEQYEPHGEVQLPQVLHYQDGKIQVDLTLLRLK